MNKEILMLIWGAIFVLAIVIEGATCELVSIWFVPGALAGLILSAFGIDIWIQLVVFVALSSVLLILAKTVFKKHLLKRSSNEKTDLDLIVGSQATVIEEIDNFMETGSVRLKGQIWTARMKDDSTKAAKGDTVTVERIEGVKLICTKK